jgi:hypothetical protein
MRLLISLIGAAALYVLAEMGRQIVQREYPLWAPRLAHRLVQIAGAFCPGRYRDIRRREWLVVLRAYQEDGGSGILWAFTTLGYLPGLYASSLRTLSVRPIKASEQQSAPAERLQLEAECVGAQVAAAAGGDEGAWSGLLDHFGGLVWSVIRGYRMSAADAADVSQTTWLRLAEHIHKVREPERIGAWLATTAGRECLRMIRQSQ